MTDLEAVRPYRKRKRAAQEEETRRRITEAVVELHRTVGPANTKITDVAEQAGVSRMTVYNQFPTEAALIGACSAHWAARNPAPDLSSWIAIDDPYDRLVYGLREFYRWYRGTEDMMGRVLRDAPLVPPLAQNLDAHWWPYVNEAVRTLAERWSSSGAANRSELLAVLRVALDFSTWRVFVDGGIGDDRAADLAALMVAGTLTTRPRTNPTAGV